MPAFLIGRAQRRLACALGIATVAIVALSPLNGARADDDDDEPFEQGIIRSLLGGGSKPPIEYRERSPLVIPPNADALPPPDASSSANNPAWPQDPDKRKARSGPRRATAAIDGEREGGRNLRPEELRRGTGGAARDNKPALTQSDNEQGRAMRPAEYGDKRTIFNFFSDKTANADAETFKSEPTRSRMTEPPPGYRTPSAAQPYREPKESAGSWFRAINPFDRGTN